MSDQPQNQWNIATEPSDMMKINPPMPVTIASTPTSQMEVIDDDSFSYDGYQVVRGEFFAHIYEPSFTFNNYKVSVNTACIRKLPDVEYVQILVNPIDKKLAVRPCREEEKDSFRWCSSGKKRSPKQITCRIFFAKVVLMVCPGFVATMRPFNGRPIKERSPRRSSSLWRAGSFLYTKGLLLR